MILCSGLGEVAVAAPKARLRLCEERCVRTNAHLRLHPLELLLIHGGSRISTSLLRRGSVVFRCDFYALYLGE